MSRLSKIVSSIHSIRILAPLLNSTSSWLWMRISMLRSTRCFVIKSVYFDKCLVKKFNAAPRGWQEGVADENWIIDMLNR